MENIRKFWLGCQNWFLCFQRIIYRAMFSKETVKSFRFSGWVRKFLGQWRTVFFTIVNPEINVQRNNLREKLSQKGKTYQFFKTPGELFFCFGGKIRQGCQNWNLRRLGRLWGKKMFQTLHNISIFFGL